MCQASCHFAAVEAGAKNVTGSVVAWNNRTTSAYSDVSDQVFLGKLDSMSELSGLVTSKVT